MPTAGDGISDAVAIDDQTRVSKYQPLYSRVTENSDGVALHFAQSQVNAAADHRNALQFLAESRAPFKICDLPGSTRCSAWNSPEP